MLCANCKAENPAGKKFCGDCGAALTTSIARAKTSNQAPIVVAESAPENREGERKTVTALFADIKGSMELMEDLDPEEARALVDPALKLMIDAVHRYDGYIVQSTGDGIFALFGAPVAHEDHPQRALYAAFRMQEELRHYSDRIRTEGGVPIQVRVGVNTGEVVVRSIRTADAHTEYTPIGHSISLASRMQTLAPIGSIAATEAVRRLCEGYFIFRSLGPTKVKGVSEPVNVHEVTGLGALRTRLQRAAGRGLTKFVGREQEMELMIHAAARAALGHGQIVAAIAEPGVGKSRLLFEFKAKNQLGWMVLEALSVSHGKASAYLPVIDLLHNYSKILPEDDARSRREKVTGRVLALDRALEDTLPYLFSLLGIVEGDDPLAQMDGQIKKWRTLEAIKRILLRESLNQPLMVLFEDLHWIDDETQAFLNLIADSIANAKILLLVNYRPEYSHQWNSKACYTQLRLDPLGRESADQMLSALLGDDNALAQLKRVIIERTEGNPFFMEETVQVLLDEGALVRNGALHLTKPISELKIPPTVQAILAARIDRLHADAKELLQTLAVIGREFALSLIRAVVPLSDEELHRILGELQLGDFIYEQPAIGDTEYIFKHALTHDVAYNSLLQERRKQLHGRIGAALEVLHSQAIEEYFGELAYHYGRSNNLAKAIDYLGLAASRNSQRAHHAEAISYVKRGLELTALLPNAKERARNELQFELIRGSAAMASRGFTSDEVLETFSRASELARDLEDPYQLFFALSGTWGYYYTRGESEAACRIAEESMTVARRSDDRGLLKFAHYNLGASLMMLADLKGARSKLESAVLIENSITPGSQQLFLGPDLNVLCLTTLGETLFSLGYPDQGLRRSYEAMTAVNRETDPFSLAMAMASVIQIHCLRGDAEKGMTLSRELIRLCTERGFPFWLAVANRCLAWSIVLQGHFHEGIASMEQLLAEAAGTSVDAEQALYNVLPTLAWAYGATGRLAEGFSALDRWREISSRHRIANMERSFWRIRGGLLFRSGAMNDAETSIRKALELSVLQSAKIDELRATSALARVITTQGRREEARAMLAAIYQWFTEGFDTIDLKDAKVLLDELT